ncbi:MAG: polyprenyl synthetase family protein [Actinomycetota bacterium]|nr:polyprenyl synthetase family protein [Actinomycetota bacterium]
MTASDFYGIQLGRQVMEDLQSVESRLKHLFDEGGQLVLKPAAKIVTFGGKRLRPTLTLVCGQSTKEDRNKLILAALAIELVHAASLIHDDVLDGALKRRGFDTVNFLLGGQAAISVGDHIFGLAFEIISSLNEPKVLRALSAAVLDLTKGEIEQTQALRDTGQTVEGYLNKSLRKTASLFAAACFTGASIAPLSEEEALAVRDFGEAIGVAFQIYDDILDITADRKDLGKPVGIDIKEGVVTLPIIYAIEESKRSEDLQRVIKDVNSSDYDILFATGIIKETSAIARAKEKATLFVKRALEALAPLPNQNLKLSLASIGKFVVERYH